MAKTEEKTCCICGKSFTGFGNSPYPVNKEEGAVCCDDCNVYVVVPARLEIYAKRKEAKRNGIHSR